MGDDVRARRGLLEFAYESSRHEHDHLLAAWQLLDIKAQATAAISGVFVAAAYAFVRNTALQINATDGWLLSAAMILLALSILSAVFAMLTRNLPTPLSSAHTMSIVKDLLAQPTQELPEREINMLADMIEQLSSTNERIARHLRSKGKWVAASQVGLVASSVIMTAMTIHAIHSAG